MAGIEAPEYQVNVSQENSINKFAVQGEENSRVLTLHLVETVQTVTALGETVIRQNPLDLTGCTVRLYVKKPDGNATFTDGTIVDTGASGTQNTVTFTLSQQTTAAAGNAHCTVAVFGSNGTELKATGITLNIAADDMEQTIVSTSEFVSLAEALNKAESAEKIATDSAAEVNQTVSVASTELQSLKTQSSDIAAAETARVDAEGKRVTAESDRATAEGIRQTAETARSDAESQRTNNESTRQTAEATRAAAESSRADAEGKRITAETARAGAETVRVDAEGKRVTAETARVDAEGKRMSAETSRAASESKRVTAETSRADAEAARATAEQARQTAESSRQTAETARESASQAAVNNADAATERANTAAKAAEDVVGGDLLIDKPDGTAGYNRLYIDDVQTVARDTKTTIPAMRTIDTQPTFKLYGYSHQDGVPTPENPIDPVSLQSPLKVTIGTTDYSIPLTASDTEKYPDGLELRAVKNHGTSILDSRDYIGLGEDGRWKIYQNVNKKVVQGVEGEDSGSGHPNQQIYTPDQSRIAHNSLWLNSYTDLAWPAGVNTGAYWICYYNNTSYYWFDGNKYTLEQIQAMEKQHPMVILYGTYKTTVIDLSDDAQTVLNKMRSAISPLANGTTLDITSTAEMDIISRSEMTKKQEQIDSNAANIAENAANIAETVSSKTGVHGLRWFDKKLQAKSGGNWDDISAVPRAFATYGVIWHYTQSSPALERTDDSAAFTATATNGATAGHSDFDDKPIYKDIKICNVVNREVVAYEGEAGFKRDGSSGDVMLEIPKFYYKVTDDGTNRYLQLSDVSLDGFSIAPRHAPCADYPNGLDKIYVGAYESTSGYKSISGAAPLVNLTRAQFRAGFAGRGAGYCQADWATQFEIQILYLIETAHLNSQLVVGNGNVNSPAAINTGGSDSVAGMTGCADKDSPSIAVKYRGLENLWGNIFEWRDGINFDDGLIYVCTNPSKYADDTAADYTALSYSKAPSDGYISAIGLDANIPWAQLPTAVAGSDSTYLCDECHFNTAGWRVACVGGYWNSKSVAGLFFASSNNNSLHYYSGNGSRLLILPES